MMSASTIEVPVQKDQLRIAASEFAKARDSLNAHVKIRIKEQSLLLTKDNAQIAIHREKEKHSVSMEMPAEIKKTAA